MINREDIKFLSKYDEPAATRVIFKDPILKCLWDEELSGQISDGAWENSSKTEWIWRADVFTGSENKVYVAYAHIIGRKNYPFYSELVTKYPDLDLSGRMIEAVKEKLNITITKDMLKVYLKQIQDMVANPVVDNDLPEKIRKFNKERTEDSKLRKQYALQELKTIEGLDVDDEFDFSIKLRTKASKEIKIHNNLYWFSLQFIDYAKGDLFVCKLYDDKVISRTLNLKKEEVLDCVMQIEKLEQYSIRR